MTFAFEFTCRVSKVAPTFDSVIITAVARGRTFNWASDPRQVPSRVYSLSEMTATLAPVQIKSSSMPQMQVAASVCLAILLAYCPSAVALDPSLDINQYARTAGKVSKGLAKGAIEQTPDRHLWLGSEGGLSRFNGVRSEVWQQRRRDHLPGNVNPSLRVSRDQTLWFAFHKAHCLSAAHSRRPDSFRKEAEMGL